MRDFWNDVRYGARMLAKSPAFTIVAILTLAVGIGANTAVFSVVNSFLFHPLPVRDPGRLVVVANGTDDYQSPHEVSNADFKDFQSQSDAFSDMTAYLIHFSGLTANNRSERVLATYVKGNYFSALGLQPALGRLFLPSEGETLDADPVIVLGYSYWKQRFNGDASIVGKTVILNGQTVTVVGVAPKGFFGTFFIVESNVYVPLGMLGNDAESKKIFNNRGERQLRALAHLKPGITMEKARASLQVIADRLNNEYPETNKDLSMAVIPETLARPEASSASLWPLIASVFLGLVGMVLLVTCVNVTNLLLARASVRSKEIAIRAALGAGRRRLFRQVLTESLLLAGLGGAAGAALGLWLMKLIETIRLPGDFPMRTSIPFDWRVFLFVASVAIACGLFAGIVPAWRASRMSLNEILRESGRSLTGGAEHNRIRNVLVAGQAAGSLVVLIMAGLFLRSLQHAQKTTLGFNPDHVLNLTMDVSQLGYDQNRGANFYRQVGERVRALPGVESASLAYSVPFGYFSQWDNVWREGQEGLPESQVPRPPHNKVDKDYFHTMGIPIVRGRGFSEQDQSTSTRVAVVNETMARTFWPGQDPIGHHFRYGTAQAEPVEVVGVAKDGKYVWIAEDQRTYFYVPTTQDYSAVRVLQVRASVPPAVLTRSIEDQIHSVEPNLPVFEVMSMDTALQGGNGLFLFRVAAIFAGILGGLSLFLAVCGVYGVVSYGVNQRTHEIGIRMALGAQQQNILHLVILQGIKLVLAGLVLGIAVSAGLARVLESLLVDTGTLDPLAYGAASLLLVAVAVMACYLPARRAMRVDPLGALRYE
jgi:predicted permease